MWTRSSPRLPVIALATLLSVAACGGSSDDSTPTTRAPEPAATSTANADQRFPNVIGAEAQRAPDNSVRFNVTVSSPYDSAERYADAWRVLGEDGTVYGVRELLHDHASEQPFTRSLDGVEIPVGVELVTIEGRDLVNGWGGQTIEVAIPPPSEEAAAADAVKLGTGSPREPA